jgi:hypothetical protein
MKEPKIRIRVYSEDGIVFEEWATKAKANPERAAEITSDMAIAGKHWILEFYDPDLPIGEAYVRLSNRPTKTSHVIPTSDAADAICDVFRKRWEKHQ